MNVVKVVNDFRVYRAESVLDYSVLFLAQAGFAFDCNIPTESTLRKILLISLMFPYFTLVACAPSTDFLLDSLRAPIRDRLRVARQAVYDVFEVAHPGIRDAYCAALAMVDAGNVSGAYVLSLTQPRPSRTPPGRLVEFQKRFRAALRDVAVLSLALLVDFRDRGIFRAALSEVYSVPILLDSNLFSQLCNAASKCFVSRPGESQLKNRRKKKIVAKVRE